MEQLYKSLTSHGFIDLNEHCELEELEKKFSIISEKQIQIVEEAIQPSTNSVPTPTLCEEPKAPAHMVQEVQRITPEEERKIRFMQEVAMIVNNKKPISVKKSSFASERGDSVRTL